MADEFTYEYDHDDFLRTLRALERAAEKVEHLGVRADILEAIDRLDARWAPRLGPADDGFRGDRAEREAVALAEVEERKGRRRARFSHSTGT